MGFSFLETGFFFTLAITFLLMLLLVYHFKQRLVSSEQKQDTMFEIINNLVTEINMLKGTIALIQRPPTPYPFSNEPISQEIKEFKENTETLEDAIELNKRTIRLFQDIADKSLVKRKKAKNNRKKKQQLDVE